MDANDIPITERAIVSGFRKRTRTKANKERVMKTRMASFRDKLPEAKGLVLVLSTNLSKSLSAMSFMAQPALLMRNVPRVKIITNLTGGIPSAARKRDHKVGARSKRVPYCLESRMRSKMADTFWGKVVGVIEIKNQNYTAHFAGVRMQKGGVKQNQVLNFQP